jgi:hypothetical protein
MALDFNPQERGMFAAPRMPNATWGGLVQGYQTMQSPLQAIGAGLDRSARISNQNKLTDLISSGRMDLNDPMKATQQALPMLNRTTESAVQNFGNLLNRSLQARQERRADAAQALQEKQAQWNREEALANLGFQNLEAQNAQETLRMEQEMNPLRRALLNEQIKSQQFNREMQRRHLAAEQAQKEKEAMLKDAYIDDKGNVVYATRGEAILKGYTPFDVTQNVRRSVLESPGNRHYIQKGVDWAKLPDDVKKRYYEESLAARNKFEDVDIGPEELEKLNQIEQSLTDEERAQFAAVPLERKAQWLLDKGKMMVIDRPWLYRYSPVGSDIEFVNYELGEDNKTKKPIRKKDNRSWLEKLLDIRK